MESAAEAAAAAAAAAYTVVAAEANRTAVQSCIVPNPLGLQLPPSCVPILQCIYSTRIAPGTRVILWQSHVH